MGRSKQVTGHVKRSLLVRGALLLPLLAAPLSILFLQTWMRLEVVANDYAIRDLTLEIRTSARTIKDLQAKTAELEGMERLYANAPSLGLVDPGPDQFQVIQVAATDGADRSEKPYDVALLNPYEQPVASRPR